MADSGKRKGRKQKQMPHISCSGTIADTAAPNRSSCYRKLMAAPIRHRPHQPPPS